MPWQYLQRLGNHSCCWICPSAKCYIGHTTEWLEYSWIPLRYLGFKDCLYANFQHIETEKDGHFQILYSEQLNSGLSVTIMQFNQVFCSIWQYFSQQEILLSRLSSFCFLTSDLHLACACIGIMLQATARWEAFFSQIFPSESPCHYLVKNCCYVTCLVLYYHHLLKAFRPNCSVWIMSVRLIRLIVSQLEGF